MASYEGVPISDEAMWAKEDAESAAEDIKAILGDLPEDDEGEVEAEASEKGEGVEAKGDDEEADETPEADDAEEEAAEEPTPESRGTLRLLEREKAISDKELELERKSREFQEREANLGSEFKQKIEELEAQSRGRLAKDDILRAIENDPLAFFEETGISPEQVGRLIIQARMGDKTPAEIKESLREYNLKRETRTELDKLKKQLEDRDYQYQVEKTKSEVVSFIDKDVRQAASKYAALSAVATVDPDLVRQTIQSVIDQDAQGKSRTGRGDSPRLSVEEAAKRVNEWWSVFQKAFTGAGTPQSGTQEKESITNEQTTPKNVKAPPKKPVGPRSTPKKLFWEEEDDAAEDMAAVFSTLRAAKKAAKTVK